MKLRPFGPNVPVGGSSGYVSVIPKCHKKAGAMSKGSRLTKIAHGHVDVLDKKRGMNFLSKN